MGGKLEPETWSNQTPRREPGGELPDIGLGDGFLDLTPKAEIKRDHIAPKGFCTAKETVHKRKDDRPNGRKYLYLIRR